METMILYNEMESAHETQLKDFFETAKSTLNNNELSYKILGFQTDNPRTDFRAGGFYSLKFMFYFCWKHKVIFNKMIQQDAFMFAIIAIKLVYVFRLFLGLTKDDENINGLKSHKMVACDRK